MGRPKSGLLYQGGLLIRVVSEQGSTVYVFLSHWPNVWRLNFGCKFRIYAAGMSLQKNSTNLSDPSLMKCKWSTTFCYTCRNFLSKYLISWLYKVVNWSVQNLISFNIRFNTKYYWYYQSILQGTYCRSTR